MARGRHKGVSDPLVPVDVHRWLVARDRYSRVVACTELQPFADLRTVLITERKRRLREGWHGCEIPTRCSFFFCDRDGERLCVAIECFEPGTRPMY